MKAYCLTPAAEEDLFEIWSFIARDNLAAADRLESDFFNAFLQLADKPDLGHFRRDLTNKPVRFLSVRGTYLIVYDPVSKPLEIMRLLHGARDMVIELQ
jgi:plasmid stabilization system protein ParE